jgi:hypothetical protein
LFKLFERYGFNPAVLPVLKREYQRWEARKAAAKN